MENRFGIKDLILFVALGLLMLIAGLAIVQYDRQWEHVKAIEDKLGDQTRELIDIQQMLKRGTIAVGGANAGTNNADVDVRERKIHAAGDYAQGDAIIDLFAVVPDKLTALINSDLYSMYVQGYVLDTLIDRDPVTLEWIPRLATKWSRSEDGKNYDFTLRSGVTFSDGTPLDADDVVFTMKLIMNEAFEAPRQRVGFEKLDHVEKTGQYGVRFVFKESYFMAFEMSGTTPVLSHKFYEQFTIKQLNESTGLLLGSGPYRLPDPRSWHPEPGKPIELVRNERYWGEPPGPNRMIWRVISLPAARMTALRNGEVDVYYQPAPDQFDEMKRDPAISSKVNLYTMDALTAGYRYIGWNQKRGGKPTPFADVRVRRAMTMLLDRDRMVRDIMHGYATVCSGPFNPQSPQSDPAVKPLPFDPDGAQRLLAEAGFKRENNALVGPDGKPFAFDILYNSGSDTAKRTITFVQDAFARAGIVVRPAASEWDIILQKTKERNFDAVFMGWGGSVEDDPSQIFTSSAMQGVGDNFVQYSNPKLDEVIEKARYTPDPKVRQGLWHETHCIIAEDQPYTFLFADKEQDAVDKRIKGVEETKLGIESLKYEWYVPRAMQKYTD